jgi:hypothetical protein
MKQVYLAAIALLTVTSAALAQDTASAQVSLDDVARADTEASTQYADRYVFNANACGMELSRAVWGKNAAILGYACFNNPNGH